MGPLPYPHRATFLATTLAVAPDQDALAPYVARLVSAILFDHLVRHPVVTLGDHDDERLTDDTGRLLDATHPQLEDSLDWFFRVSRRHEVLWFELGIDPARPQPAVLRSRRPRAAGQPAVSPGGGEPDGSAGGAGDRGPPPLRGINRWVASGELELSQQLGQCLALWLAARRLPPVGPLPAFSVDDLRDVAGRLAMADELIGQGRELGIVPRALTQPPPRLPVAFLRVLAELSRDDARTIDPAILRIDPSHPVARRNSYVTGLATGEVDRRAILPLTEEAPMYARPHLSIWGEPFAADRPLENMGVRHQGIAASLMPANPYACHNYSLQLAEVGRREESYRWADRATAAAPQFGAAHLDCVRRLRQVGRPGQAFAEAQYRCREILDRTAAGKLSGNDWQAPHHAALLIALVHLDVGRLAEATELADEVIARLPEDTATRDAFSWATRRIAHWKTDPGVLARAHAAEGHHRGDVGRVLAGLGRTRIADDDDAMMLIEALCAIGRTDQAVTAYWQCAGLDALGDGKARLAAARALIVAGDLDEALDQIQIVQLRRGQGRLEAEINRVLRLAAIRPASDWEPVIARRLDRGAAALAQRAARDLCDFVPGLDTEVIRRALGSRRRLAIDPLWIAELIAAVPGAQGSSPAIVARLAPPEHATLAAADALAAEWWTQLVPAARDRDAHAAGAVLALGLALAHYLALASGPPSPIAGAYRHIATEALQLVRRARSQVDAAAITGLLQMIDWFGDTPDWLLDPWLLQVERALDLEAEHGAYLEGMIAGMPSVQRLLRGDERIGWELRLAHDLAGDPSQYEAAAALFARAARAVDAGGALRAWSAAAASAPSTVDAAARLDVHWTAALAHPTGAAEPWLDLARGLFAAGRNDDGFAAACRGMAATPARDRPRALAELAPAWAAAGLAIPFDGASAFELGAAAAAGDRLDDAVGALRWAAAVDPSNARRVQSLAVALGRRGLEHEAIRALSPHERTDAPRAIGRVLFEAGRFADAVRILSYAARRFRAADDWAMLATAAHRADDDAVAAAAARRAVELGAEDPAVLAVLVTSLYRIGEFVACEQLAQRLIGHADRAARLAGLHAMARALAGQGRHVDALRYAKAASELAQGETGGESPDGSGGGAAGRGPPPRRGIDGRLAAELADTLDRIVAQEVPMVRASAELSMERQACDELEAGKFDSLIAAVSSPSWGIAHAALAACEVRRDDEGGIPVSPRALDAAIEILARSAGATQPDAVLARIRALRIRDNAFIQSDPPPPLGTCSTPEQFEREYAEREGRPGRPSTAAVGPR
jgi:tetratricopeptide (TPR) repeat protein